MQGISEVELSYFELQAYVGTTKHMGGLKATKELIALCPIDGDVHVLDVGCGAGATACYLAKKYGCRVMGVDLLESMVARSKERAQREGVAHRVEFRVADAQNLPFAEALFDVVIGESVITFVEDKQKAVSECVRVAKPGGYVGLNEETWIKTPVPAELVEFVSRTWGGARPETSNGWVALLEGSGLRDVVVRTHRFSALKEASQIRRYSLGDLSRMLYRALSLYIGSPAFRRYMRGRRPLPKNIWEYLGYGLYVGRK
ncbi:MAG: class I SAM-dependent methyltransferase [Anaerolineae bacterium]